MPQLAPEVLPQLGMTCLSQSARLSWDSVLALNDPIQELEIHDAFWVLDLLYVVSFEKVPELGKRRFGIDLLDRIYGIDLRVVEQRHATTALLPQQNTSSP